MNIVPYEPIDGHYLSEQKECIYVHDENMYASHLHFTERNKDAEGWVKNAREGSNRYGFITYVKKNVRGVDFPSYKAFKFGEYYDLVYPVEEILLIDFINKNKDKFFLIDPLGYCLSDKGLTFNYVIKRRLFEVLKPYSNGMLLWGDLESRYLTNKQKYDIMKQA